MRRQAPPRDLLGVGGKRKGKGKERESGAYTNEDCDGGLRRGVERGCCGCGYDCIGGMGVLLLLLLLLLLLGLGLGLGSGLDL